MFLSSISCTRSENILPPTFAISFYLNGTFPVSSTDNSFGGNSFQFLFRTLLVARSIPDGIGELGRSRVDEIAAAEFTVDM
ncbi:hypothetical protein ES288_A05G439200v1, partial [Gossypium darwinii]